MISTLVSQLSGAGFNAVITNDSDISGVDTAIGINDMFNALVDNRVYPLALPEDAVLPSIIYQPIEQQTIESEGEKLGRVDTYLISLRAKTFADLQARSLQLQSTVAAQPGQVEIVNAGADYEDTEEQFRCHLEIEITTLATANQTFPAALVYQSSASAERSGFDNFVRQSVEDIYSVVLVCLHGELEQRRQECRSALIGKSLSSISDATEYLGGNRLAQTGQLVYWREQFTSGHSIQQS